MRIKQVDDVTRRCHSWPAERFIIAEEASDQGSVKGAKSSIDASKDKALAIKQVKEGDVATPKGDDKDVHASVLTPQALAWAGFYHAPDRSSDDRWVIVIALRVVLCSCLVGAFRVVSCSVG